MITLAGFSRRTTPHALARLSADESGIVPVQGGPRRGQADLRSASRSALRPTDSNRPDLYGRSWPPAGVLRQLVFGFRDHRRRAASDRRFPAPLPDWPKSSSQNFFMIRPQKIMKRKKTSV